jgi:2-beta-glucuronyltransferase
MGPNNIFQEMDHFNSFIAYQLLRPPSRLGRFGNWLSYPLFSMLSPNMLTRLEAVVRGADLVIVESGTGVMLFDACKKMNSTARFVYRVSDNIRLFRSHAIVLDTETRIAPQFDMVSTPTETIYKHFAHLSTAGLHRHGIPLHVYDRLYPNPFQPTGRKNAVFVGTNSLDNDFLARASRLFPELEFHIIGPMEGVPEAANIKQYGEVAYETAVPYIKWADIALNPRTLPTLADSNKVVQYEHCHLPIVMSEMDVCDRPHVFRYRPGDSESIAVALRGALAYDHRLVKSDGAGSWDSVSETLWGESLDA